MPGFFKVDIDDYFEFWSVQPPKLYALYSFLLASAWRKPVIPKCSAERHFRVTLWQNQLVFHGRQFAIQLGIPESTLRDLLKKLEEHEMIKINTPVDGIKVITVMGVYEYGDHGERIPCMYRAPSVVDLRTHRDRTEPDPSVHPVISNSCNKLDQCETGILEDSRLKEVENYDKPVNERTNEPEHVGVGDQKTEETPFSDSDYEDLAKYVIESDPNLTLEQARQHAVLLLTGDDVQWSPD